MLSVYQCQCALCQSSMEHPEQVLHHQINLLMSQLDERQRRLFAALEAERYGHGGTTYMAQVTGLDPKTIRRGRQELSQSLPASSPNRVRQGGAGRPTLEKKAANRNGAARSGAG